MTAVLLALLSGAPALAADYPARGRALVSDYVAEARARLAASRESLEAVQELMLTPHSADGPAEAALLHLDLAEAYLRAASSALPALAPVSPPAGWRPFEARLAEARGLLRKAAPELDAALEEFPVEAGPLERNTVAMTSCRAGRVRLRGFFALSAASAEYLGSLLAHEAEHVRQCRAARARGEYFAPTAAEEEAARRAEAAFWRAIGAPRDKDFDGAAAQVLAAAEAGDRALSEHVARESASAVSWEWVTPRAAPPAPPPARGAAPEPAEDPRAAAAALEARIRGVRDDRARSAGRFLDSARGVLGAVVELTAPERKIVNFELVQVWALQPERYPPGVHAAFRALHPVMTELDRARAALAAPEASAEDRALLKAYAPDREGASGARARRTGDADIAGAWEAHLERHRRQKTAAPTLSEETEAVEASLDAWNDSGADARFDKSFPDRFLRFRVAREEGGREGLRAYLESLGFSD